MIADRLPELLKRMTHEQWTRLGMAAGAAAAVTLTVTAGLAVANSAPAYTTTAQRGPIAEGRVLTIAAGFDPSQPMDQAPGWRFGADASLNRAEGEAARLINSAIPFAADLTQPAAPFYLQARSTAERNRAVRCLANAVYYEAALEPADGQQAVAQVVLNRVRDPNFPNSVCGVVYEGWERVTGCQFSFTCDGALARGPDPVLWEKARRVAEAALSGYVQKNIGAATHYHADYVAPYWASDLVKIAKIGTHIFYRWPGEAGLPHALTAVYRGGELRLSEAVLSGRAARQKAEPAELIQTAALVDPAPGAERARVTGVISQPELYGRRTASPEEIAKINALLEERFPSKDQAETTAPAPAQPVSAPVAAAGTSFAG